MAEAKARFHNYQHLDQRCPWGKRPLKLTFKEYREQPEKIKSKVTTSGLSVTPPAKPSSSSGPQQSEHSPEASEKARKEKKKANRKQRGIGRREESTPATGSNAKKTLPVRRTGTLAK